VVHLPARDIPIPTSVSAEAQAIMAMAPMDQPPLPPADDLEAWRAHIKAHDETIASLMAERTAGAPVTATTLEVDGVVVHELVPEGLADGDRRTYLDIHGGAFV